MSVLYYTIIFIKLHYYIGQNVIILYDTYIYISIINIYFFKGSVDRF